MLLKSAPPGWPKHLPCVWSPVARVRLADVRDVLRLTRRDPVTDAEVYRALSIQPAHYSTFGTNVWGEPFFSNTANGTANTTNGSETSLLTGLNAQPKISPPTWDTVPGATGRGVRFMAEGYLSTTTGPPTLTLFCRLSSSQGSSTLSGTVIGQSAAITTVASQTNKFWQLRLETICRTPGEGSGNATLYSAGFVRSSAGFASPFEYTLTPGTGDSTTVTATIDGSVSQFFNLSSTWSSASNSQTLTGLRAYGW